MMTKERKVYGAATFGGGCFWCVEAVFQNINGVENVVSGYSGGRIANPTYREVSSGLTGHAEVVNVLYNTDQISFKELLEIFWQTHDPTTPDRQGADSGTQYRSVVFYHTEIQKEQASSYKQELNSLAMFKGRTIVTEIVPFSIFYPAENYHQHFFDNNKDHPYCQMVIQPKIDRLKAVFGEKLKL